MHRPYKAAKFVEICEKMRGARPDLGITTDIIVGFPGETEEDYRATRDLVKHIQFDNAFVFRYSKRRNTPAAEMEESLQLPEKIKEERNQDLLKVVNEISVKKNTTFIGQTLQVLCEGTSKTNAARMAGRASNNKIVIFDGNVERHTGEMVDIHIRETTGFSLYGDLVMADEPALATY